MAGSASGRGLASPYWISEPSSARRLLIRAIAWDRVTTAPSSVAGSRNCQVGGLGVSSIAIKLDGRLHFDRLRQWQLLGRRPLHLCRTAQAGRTTQPAGAGLSALRASRQSLAARINSPSRHHRIDATPPLTWGSNSARHMSDRGRVPSCCTKLNHPTLVFAAEFWLLYNGGAEQDCL